MSFQDLQQNNQQISEPVSIIPQLSSLHNYGNSDLMETPHLIQKRILLQQCNIPKDLSVKCGLIQRGGRMRRNNGSAVTRSARFVTQVCKEPKGQDRGARKLKSR